jgi:hypothetical protein
MVLMAWFRALTLPPRDVQTSRVRTVTTFPMLLTKASINDNKLPFIVNEMLRVDPARRPKTTHATVIESGVTLQRAARSQPHYLLFAHT